MATQKTLSLFRIALYGVILAELSELATKAEYAFFHDYSYKYVLPVAILLCLSTLVGAFTRLSSILFLVAVKFLHRDLYAWYEVDWVIALMAFLFCFAPNSKVWSVDALRKRAPKASGEEALEPPFVYAVVAVMTLLYFDSLITKFASYSWTNGTTVWLASFVPHVARYELPEWMQIDLLLKVSTFGTILYESLFFLVLFRKLRPFIVAAGLGLHLGIAIFLPLTYFGLIMAAPLLLFLNLGKSHAPPPAKWSKTLNWATYLYLALILGSYAHMKFNGNARSGLEQLLGVHPTGVYSDGKFLIQAPIVRLEISTSSGAQPLPSFTQEGFPQIRDRDWKVFGFFLRMRSCNMGDLIRYIQRYQNRCDQLACNVAIYVKDAMMYSLDFNPQAIADFKKRPWTKIGQVEWSPVLGGGGMQWRDEADQKIRAFREQFLTICD